MELVRRGFAWPRDTDEYNKLLRVDRENVRTLRALRDIRNSQQWRSGMIAFDDHILGWPELKAVLSEASLEVRCVQASLTRRRFIAVRLISMTTGQHSSAFQCSDS